MFKEINCIVCLSFITYTVYKYKTFNFGQFIYEYFFICISCICSFWLNKWFAYIFFTCIMYWFSFDCSVTFFVIFGHSCTMVSTLLLLVQIIASDLTKYQNATPAVNIVNFDKFKMCKYRNSLNYDLWERAKFVVMRQHFLSLIVVI